MTINRWHGVIHYFCDHQNKLSYYPGETFTTEQLVARGMSVPDIENAIFRGNFEVIEGEVGGGPQSSDFAMLIDAASGTAPAAPSPPAEDAADQA